MPMAKHIKAISLFLILSMLISCKNPGKTDTELPPESFRQYLKKFKYLSLPIVLRPHTETLGGAKFDNTSSDTLYTGDHAQLYGMLPDTNTFYGLITLHEADDLVPVLTTYDKKGKKLGSTPLIANGCGSGPGLEYCSSSGVINNDLTIYCADTLKTIEFDSIYNPIAGTEKEYCVFIEGHINPAGKIEMKEEKTMMLK
jgi:hypothetical protein